MSKKKEIEYNGEGTLLVRVHPAQEVIAEKKIPDVETGEPLILNSNPDGPFSMMVTARDFAILLKTLESLLEEEEVDR